jgi:hypothetical protein
MRKYNWAIVDSKGKIIEKFRNKLTAYAWMPVLKERALDDIKIIKLDSNNTK